MNNKNREIDRGDLKQNLSENLFGRLLMARVSDGEHLYYPVIGLNNQVRLLHLLVLSLVLY